MKVPVIQAPLQRMMMAGLPRNIALLSATMAAILVLGLQKLFMIVIALGLHFLLVVLYKKDD